MHARLATVKPQPVQLSKNPFPQESLRQRNKTMGDDGRTFTQELREKNNGEDGEFGNGRDGGRNPGNLAVTFFDACRLGGGLAGLVWNDGRGDSFDTQRPGCQDLKTGAAGANQTLHLGQGWQGLRTEKAV